MPAKAGIHCADDSISVPVALFHVRMMAGADVVASLVPPGIRRAANFRGARAARMKMATGRWGGGGGNLAHHARQHAPLGGVGDG